MDAIALGYKRIVARKNHRCDLCGEEIQKGETYARWVNIDGGKAFSTKLHGNCENAVNDCCRAGDETEWCNDWVQEHCIQELRDSGVNADFHEMTMKQIVELYNEKVK